MVTAVPRPGLYEGRDGALAFVVGTACVGDDKTPHVLFRYVSLPVEGVGRWYHTTYALIPDDFSAMYVPSKKLYNL